MRRGRNGENSEIKTIALGYIVGAYEMKAYELLKPHTAEAKGNTSTNIRTSVFVLQ